MASLDKAGVPDRAAIVAVAIAAALAAWQGIAQYGWLSVVFGSLAFVFWGAVLVWIACVVQVIRYQRRWWVLLTAPIVLYPVVMSALLIRACSQGTCL